MKSKTKWALDDQTIAFIQIIKTALAKVGWHCALTGGVLYRGSSTKDLDLVVYPAQKRWWRPLNKRAMREALKSAGLIQTVSRAAVKRSWRERGIKDQKYVEVWRRALVIGSRIDVMVMA